jgi:hypothetical protein
VLPFQLIQKGLLKPFLMVCRSLPCCSSSDSELLLLPTAAAAAGLGFCVALRLPMGAWDTAVYT